MRNRNPKEEAIVGLLTLLATILIYPVGTAYFYIMAVLHENLLQPVYLWLGELHPHPWFATPVGVILTLALVFWPVVLVVASTAMYQLVRLARHRSTLSFVT